MDMNYIGRFAPSPTGRLHIGSLLTALASYADARAVVAGRVEGEDLDRPPALPAHGHQVLERDEALVGEGQDQDLGPDPGDEPGQGPGHLATAVEHALGGLVAGVDPLAGDAVVLRGVPAHEGLPHVVVGEVAVLVVGRVEVGQVHGLQLVDDLRGVGAQGPAPPRAVGESAAYEPPETVVIDFASSEQRPSARVALRPGRGHDLVRNGRLAAPMAGDPEGFEVYELPLTPVLVGEICALGADAIALAPEELVDDVVARLRAVAGRWAR